MRRLILAIIGLTVLLASCHREDKSADAYIRDRVLMLTGNGIECSAIEIKAPSGKNYTLSSAHCRGMLINESVTATAEDGTERLLMLVDLDIQHDLMLLTAFDKNSIDVAKDSRKYQKVHTITHGHGKAAYRTDGELLAEEMVNIVEPINSEDDMNSCKPPHSIIMTMDGIGCAMQIDIINSTAQVIAGSSGGAVLNEAGELVGIVCCTDGYFSGFIPLSDIKTFIKAK